MDLSFVTLPAGRSLSDHSKTLGVPVSVLQQLTQIDDADAKLTTAWTIPDPKTLIDAKKVQGLPEQLTVPASSNTSTGAGQFKAIALHQQFDVSLEHDNRGDAGSVQAGETRLAARMEAEPGVIRYADKRADIFWIPEGLFIVNVGSSPKDSAVSVDQAITPPGVQTALHSLKNVDERYLIESGTGVMEVGGVTQRVGPGDLVNIPAGTKQRITNDGDDLLCFWCIVSDRFVPDEYVHHEDAKVPYEMFQSVPAGRKGKSFDTERPETLLITKGAGQITHGGETFNVKAGDLLKVPQGMKVSISAAAGEDPFEIQHRVESPAK